MNIAPWLKHWHTEHDSMSEKRFVSPGEEIGTEEEYVAGFGTYVEDAKIYSALYGELSDENHTLSVGGSPTLRKFANGTLVVGRIDNISEPVALSVVSGDSEAIKQVTDRYPSTSAYVVLHASFIKRGYVKKVRDEYRIGDLIRGRVVEEKFGEYHISTDDPHCGCVLAFCSACRTPLEKRDSILNCPSCGRRENRHLADDYKLIASG